MTGLFPLAGLVVVGVGGAKAILIAGVAVAGGACRWLRGVVSGEIED